MQLLTQNSKMKKSSTKEIAVYNWTIPAYKALDGTITCPSASKCIKGCYAQQGAYIWNNVKLVHNEKLQLTKTDEFISVMIAEIESKLKKHKHVYIRIHDAGDFYSDEYTQRWLSIISQFVGKSVTFYAYTKEVKRFKSMIVPHNLILIYSFGGKDDKLIDVKKDRHSKVFENSEDMQGTGYVDASHDDLKALTENVKVGLAYHGTKSYKNTTWNKVG